MIPIKITRDEKIVTIKGVFSSIRFHLVRYLISIIKFVMILRKFSIRNLLGNVNMLNISRKLMIFPIREFRNLTLLKYEANPVNITNTT